MKLLPFGLVACLLCGSGASALDIVIQPGAGLLANPAALAAFERAALTWESLFSDPITVTVDADLLDLGASNILGQASSVELVASYTTMRNQLVADSLDEPDDSLVSFLPTAEQASFTLPDGFSLTGNIRATKANLKALGFAGLDTSFGVSDGLIEFNSNFSFDFDRSDGISPTAIDFESVALHELGHTLGFISAVDFIDFYQGQDPPGGEIDLTFLDLFRFQNGSADDPETTADFTTMSRYLLPGGEAIFDTLDDEYALSTGLDFGDGNQASHFKDNVLTGFLIGLMDPTLAYGQSVPVSDADIRVLDLIGWDYVVPESGSWAWMAGLAWVAMRRRRR